MGKKNTTASAGSSVNVAEAVRRNSDAIRIMQQQLMQIASDLKNLSFNAEKSNNPDT